MKIVKIAFVTVLMLMAVAVSATTTDSKALAQAESNLKKQLNHFFLQSPLTDLIDQNESGIVYLYLTINEDNEIGELRVVGKNCELVNYIERVLPNKELKVSPLLQGEKIYLPVRFVMK